MGIGGMAVKFANANKQLLMTHTELRVGNWVRTCTPNMEIMIPHLDAQVQGIEFGGRLLFCNTPASEGFVMYPQHVAGIPLDVDWLERFGFEVKPSMSAVLYIDQEPVIYLDHTYGGGWYLSFWPYTRRVLHIQWIHQLQNLYFALTGQELTYNATKHEPDPGTPRP